MLSLKNHEWLNIISVMTGISRERAPMAVCVAGVVAMGLGLAFITAVAASSGSRPDRISVRQSGEYKVVIESSRPILYSDARMQRVIDEINQKCKPADRLDIEPDSVVRSLVKKTGVRECSRLLSADIPRGLP
jgi:hypothetical protein